MKNFTKTILASFVLLFVLSNLGWGQTTIHTNNCSAATANWTYTNAGGIAIQQSGYWLVDYIGDEIISQTFDVTSYTGLTLTFKVGTYGSGTNHPCLVEYSTDNGATWSANTFTSATPTSSTMISAGTWNIGTINSTQFKLKWTSPLGGSKGVRIDDILFTGTVSATYDTDSKVEDPTSQITAGNIASTNTASGSAVSVFNFKIRDLGTSDGLATKVTKVTIKKSSGTATLSSTIAGAELWDGSSQITTGTPTITDNDITFNITSGNLDIANGSSKDITMKVWLMTTNIIDNSTFSFKVLQTSHGFTADATGSTFASDFGAEVTGNTMTVTVSATKLEFGSGKPPAIVTLNTGFNVEVKATDDNGNLDADAANTVLLSRVTGTGRLTSPTGLSQALVNGIYNWTDAKYNIAEVFTINASASGLTTAVSSDITCQDFVYGATDLFISEYVEGSSNNKYIEIYNGTGADVDLSNYRLRLYSNGSLSPTSDVLLSGTLSSGNVIVYKNSSAAIYSGTATVNASVNFTGDDAVSLFSISKNKNVDIFGVIGDDPGTAWTEGSYSTTNKTLVRNNTVVEGITINPSGTGTSAFTTLSTEWGLYDQDVITNLGVHTFSPVPAGNTTLSIALGDNDYSFANTSVKVSFKGVTSTGDITIKRFNNEAANVSGISETNVSKFKWLVTNSGVVFGATTEIRFKASELTGIGNPETNTIRLYKRETPGTGAFSLVGIFNYDAVNDELYTTVSSFSEFVMSSNDAPLPVTLSSFNSIPSKNNITLNWSTSSEANNSGFDVERKGTNESNWMKAGYVQGSGNSNSTKNYSFTDRGLQTGKYQYRLKQIDFNGNYEYFDLNGYVEVGVPNKYDISQNYPNPFNPVTKIDYDLPFDSKVSLRIYDVTGREVKSLFSGDVKAGYYTQMFDASSLSSGIYFYRITANSLSGNFVMTKKMALIK